MEWSVGRNRPRGTVTLAGLAFVVSMLVLATGTVHADEAEDVEEALEKIQADAERALEEVDRPDDDTTPVPDGTHRTLSPGMARLMALMGIHASPTPPDTAMSSDEGTADEGGSQDRDPASGSDDGPEDTDEGRDGPQDDGSALVDDMLDTAEETAPAVRELLDAETRPLVGQVGRITQTPLPMLVPDGEAAADAAPMGPPKPTTQRLAADGAAAPALSPILAAGLILAGGAAATAATAAMAGHPFGTRFVLALRRLAAGLGALPLFSKIKKGAVLDHPLREQVVEALRAEPGMTTQALRRRFEVGYSTLAHHVRILEQHDLVTAQREGRHRRLFVVGTTDRRARAGAALLANHATARVYEAVQAHPGGSLKRIAQATGVGANTVHWHLRRLEDAGLVTKRRVGRHVAVDPATTAPEGPGDHGRPTTIETPIPAMDQA